MQNNKKYNWGLAMGDDVKRTKKEYFKDMYNVDTGEWVAFVVWFNTARSSQYLKERH